MRGFQSVSGKNYSSRLVPDFGSVQTGEPTDEKKLSGGIVLDINKSNKYVWGIQNIASMHTSSDHPASNSRHWLSANFKFSDWLTDV